MFIRKRVLEIGSLDINGSVRSFFEQCDYTGLDIGPGPGVDVVCEGQKYDAPSASYDLVICCEVMEHNPFWPETFRNMMRLLRPGGIMVMSCATKGRLEHGTTRTDIGSSPHTVDQGWDYYRNLVAKDVTHEVDLSELCSWGFATNLQSWDLYMLGVKAGCDFDAAKRIAEFRAIYRRRYISALRRRLIDTLLNPARFVRFLRRYS